MENRTKSNKPRKQVGDYILEKAIGFGAFSTVYEGYNVSNNDKVAVKSINLHRINVNAKHQTNLKQEIDILRKCRHINIVQLLHTYQTSNHIYLIMQFCAGGDLHRFLTRNGRMTESNAQNFTIQFTQGLRYLHSLEIIHRDLKPQNILLSQSSTKAILRIADFGFARYKPNGCNMVDTMCGSPLYMAPEILKFTKYDSKVDLWSAGTIIYQMVTKEPPFNGVNHIELLKKIENTKQLRFPSHLSNECKDLIVRLLKRNPQQRISWNEFFNHPWLNVIDTHKQQQHTQIKKHSSTKPPKSIQRRSTFTHNNNHTHSHNHKHKNGHQSSHSSHSSHSNERLSNRDRNNNGNITHHRMNNGKSHNKVICSPPLSAAGSGSNNTPEYVMIENKNEEKMPTINFNSKLYLDFCNKCNHKFEGIQTEYEYAKYIMQVGNVQVSEDEISSALLLYLRGLDVLEKVILDIQSWISMYAVSHKYYHSKFKRKDKYKNLNTNDQTQNKLDQCSIKYKQLLLDSIACYTGHLKRSDAIEKLVSSHNLVFKLNRMNIDEIIFLHAIGIAKKACSDVLLNINTNDSDGDCNGNDNAQNKIIQCKFMLEYLMTLNTVSKEDKQQITKYINAAQTTLQAIEKLHG